MKQYTSKFLKSIAILYLSLPISYIVMVAVLFDIPAESCVRILLNPFYYVVTFLGVIAGYGLKEMRRWSWYVLVASNIVFAYENIHFVYEYGESHHKFLAFLFALAVQCALVYWVAKEIRVPYFFPKIRWWESNPRYRLSVPTKLARRDEKIVDGEILDISVGGCFIKLQDDLIQDEHVTVNFSIYGEMISTRGTVVWRTQSTVTHPKGVGVKFDRLKGTEKRALRVITRKLKKVAVLYRRSRYLVNSEDFQRQLDELETKRTS